MVPHPTGHSQVPGPLAELDDLRPLVRDPGPFLSAYVAFGPGDVRTDGTGARWRARRLALAAAGAPQHVLAVMEAALGPDQPADGGACVVVSADGDPHVEYLRVAPEESATWTPRPRLRPLVAARQRAQRRVVALVDRSGADVQAGPEPHTGGSVQQTVLAPARRRDGRARPWPRAIVDVAREVSGLTAMTDARLVAVGGDDEAVDLLTDELPPPVRAVLQPIDAERAAGPASEDAGALAGDEVQALVDDWVEGRLREDVRTVEARLAAGEGAVAGPDDTLDALRADAVAALLVTYGAGPRRRAWAGDRPRDVATSPLRLRDVHGARSVPVLDAAVVAALDLGVDVRVVPAPLSAGLRDGIAAVLARPHR